MLQLQLFLLENMCMACLFGPAVSHYYHITEPHWSCGLGNYIHHNWWDKCSWIYFPVPQIWVCLEDCRYPPYLGFGARSMFYLFSTFINAFTVGLLRFISYYFLLHTLIVMHLNVWRLLIQHRLNCWPLSSFTTAVWTNVLSQVGEYMCVLTLAYTKWLLIFSENHCLCCICFGHLFLICLLQVPHLFKCYINC